MRRIQSKGMRPEMRVRRTAHGLGYRYRLHGRDLPGKPDLVFRSRKKAIFVHGCFWHHHTHCKISRTPRSNQQYWTAKLRRNVERDAEHLVALAALEWSVLVIWECETLQQDLAQRIRLFLESSAKRTEHGQPANRLPMR